MAQLTVVGHRVPRVDGPDKVTGRARYTADVSLPGTLWGKVLRSTVAHARILAVDTSAARQVPGVIAVLAGADLPDPRRRVGRRLLDVPILAFDRVRYLGEPIAAVAAETPEAAEEALARIEVEYEDLPALFDPERALDPDAPVLHPDLLTYAGLSPDRPADSPLNLQGYLHRERGDVEQGLAEGDVVLEAVYTSPAVHQGYLEPHAVVAHFHPDDQALDVWLTNKTPFAVRNQLAAALDLDRQRVRVHPAAIGGDFGGKGGPMLAPVAALLSRAAGGRPVRIIFTYLEELTAGNPRHGARVRIRAGARRDGTLTAWDVDILLDSGAYGGYKPSPDHVVHGVVRAAGPYRIPHARLTVRTVYTNTVPRGHMRAPGEPQVVFARELHLDTLARQLGLDGLEIRRRNLLDSGEAQPVGGVWKHPTAHQVLEQAAQAIEWASPRPAGVGRAVAVTDRGTGSGHSGAVLRLAPDGTAELLTGVPDTGAGSHTLMQQIVAEVLGLDPTRVRVRIGGTDEAPEDSGAGGSRVTNVAGHATLQAAEDVARQVRGLAAETYGWQEERVALREGRVGPDETFQDEAVAVDTLLARYGQALVGEARYVQEARGGEAAVTVQAAEVAVDEETGQVQVRRFISVHDVGAILNPIAFEGQIEGGFVQGLGMTLMEEVDISREDGRVGTVSLGDYKLPGPLDVPPFEMQFIHGGTGPAPWGGKGVGETSTSAVPPAIAAAILDATGVVVRDLPITAARLLAGLRARGTER